MVQQFMLYHYSFVYGVAVMLKFLLRRINDSAPLSKEFREQLSGKHGLLFDNMLHIYKTAYDFLIWNPQSGLFSMPIIFAFNS